MRSPRADVSLTLVSPFVRGRWGRVPVQPMSVGSRTAISGARSLGSLPRPLLPATSRTRRAGRGIAIGSAPRWGRVRGGGAGTDRGPPRGGCAGGRVRPPSARVGPFRAPRAVPGGPRRRDAVGLRGGRRGCVAPSLRLRRPRRPAALGWVGRLRWLRSGRGCGRPAGRGSACRRSWRVLRGVEGGTGLSTEGASGAAEVFAETVVAAHGPVPVGARGEVHEAAQQLLGAPETLRPLLRPAACDVGAEAGDLLGLPDGGLIHLADDFRVPVEVVVQAVELVGGEVVQSDARSEEHTS